MRTALAIATICLGVLPVMAQDDRLNGVDFLRMCASSNFEAAVFVRGVVEGVQIGSGTERAGINLCVPTDIPLGQVKDLVCKSVATAPVGELDRSASILTVLTLAKEYPCP